MSLKRLADCYNIPSIREYISTFPPEFNARRLSGVLDSKAAWQDIQRSDIPVILAWRPSYDDYRYTYSAYKSITPPKYEKGKMYSFKVLAVNPCLITMLSNDVPNLVSIVDIIDVIRGDFDNLLMIYK